MLRHDGKFEIYVIEFKDSQKWESVNYDVNWVPEQHYDENLWKHFSANGECWQTTGIHGTFDIEIARKMLCVLHKHSPYDFRVKKVVIWQESTIVWTMLRRWRKEKWKVIVN